MKNKISAILIATLLIAGCSSGGGTSGAGGSGTTTVGGLLLTASLSPSGTFTVKVINTSNTVTGDSFPIGIILESYTVSYVAQSNESAPALTPRTFGQTVPIINDFISHGIPVILKSNFTVQEFNAFNPNPGTSKAYRTTVNYRGRTLSGERFTLAADTVLTF